MTSYIGDFNPSDVFNTKFTTVTSSGAPATFTGSPAVVCYKNNSTVSTTLGITLTTDFASITGFNNVNVDTSATAGFYASGSDFMLVASAGTAGGVSIVGYVVGEFSIGHRSALRPTTAGRTLDVSATGEAGVDWANVGSPTTTVALTNTTILSAGTVTTVSTTVSSNVTQWNGTNVSAATAGIPDVNVKNINNVAAATPGAAGGLLIAGSNAATTFASVVFTGTVTMSDGLSISRTTTNSSALTATGNGTGSGAVFTSGSGATGDAVQMTATSTNGNGLKLLGTGTQNGLRAIGGNGTDGDGFHCEGGTGSSQGIRAIGGGTAGHGFMAYSIGTGNGMFLTANTGNQSALVCTGQGDGTGATFTSGSGATAPGVLMRSTSTNGDGFRAEGGGTGNGIYCQGGNGVNGDGLHCTAGSSDGVGIRALGGSVTGAGLYAAASAGNAAGIQAVANGSGTDIVGVLGDLSVTTYAEPGQEAPAATTTLKNRLLYLYKLLRNKKTQTATEFDLYNDGGTVVDQKSTVSDDGTTATRGQLGTGP